jgi:hypothetical protein
MSMTTPYTYRIFCRATNQYYYGVRFAKNCNPSDLFVKYFTSSNGVKRLIDEYGTEVFYIEIRKIFDTTEDAKSWERRVNRWTMRWSNYLNKHSNGNFILTDKERIEIGTKAGNKCRDLGLGFHSMSADERRLASRKGAETNKKNNTGIYSITLDKKISIGNNCRDLGLGFHSKESREKQKNSARKPWWTNGQIDVKSETCPGHGWEQGRLTKGKKWWNNGIKSIMVTIPPDDTWMKGRLNWRK